MGINIRRRKFEDNILAGEGLEASEHKYHLAIKHIPGLVCRGYEDWSVDFIDNKVGELTGYDKKEFDARRLKWSDLIIKEDIEAVKASVLEAINTGNSYLREYRIKTATGKILWMEDRGQIITNETGDLEYFSGVIFDITNQKHTEEKLRQNEHYYRSILKHMHENIAVINRDYRITDVNTAFLTTVGCTREAAVGRHCHEVLHGCSEPCDRNGRVCMLPEVFETGRPLQCLHERATADGSPVCLDMIVSPLKDGQGKVTHVIEAARDVTDHRRTEEALMQSEEKYRHLVNHASDAIFITQDDTIKFSNPKTEEISGYSAAELAQIPFVNFLHHEDRDMVIDRYRGSLKGEKSADTISFRILNKAGEEIWVQPKASAIVWDHRPATLIFLRDITALKQAEEERKQIEGQLVQSAKLSALGELTAGVSHELNQPLNGIKITSQSLLRDIKKNRLEEEELEEDLTEIVKQVNKMAEIIDHMRVYTRNTEGKPSEVIDICTVIEGPFKILDQQLKTHGIGVIRDFAAGLPQVTCDPIRLEQVFLNLINNARLALDGCGKENKRIEIRACQSDDKQAVEVAVKDNGQGIAEHLRQKIFQPFFTTREPGKGTGLGLSVSHKIIEEHQGRIELESKVGEGTTFKVILPTAD